MPAPKRPVGRPRTSTLTFVGVRVPRALLARIDAEAERRRLAGEAGGSRSAVIVAAVEGRLAIGPTTAHTPRT